MIVIFDIVMNIFSFAVVVLFCFNSIQFIVLILKYTSGTILTPWGRAAKST